DWVFSAEAAGQISQSGLIAGITVGGSRPFSGTVGVRRMLSTGGTAGLPGGVTYSRTDAGTLGIQEFWSDGVGVSLLQPLLRGRGSDIYNANEQRATIRRDVTVLARRATALATVQEIVSAYWDLVL